MAFFLAWFLLAIAVGIFAANKGRSGVGWFFLSLLISPLLGFIFVAVSRDLKGERLAAELAATTRKCPQCAELVKTEAKICRHCGSELPPAPAHPETTEAYGI